MTNENAPRPTYGDRIPFRMDGFFWNQPFLYALALFRHDAGLLEVTLAWTFGAYLFFLPWTVMRVARRQPVPAARRALIVLLCGLVPWLLFPIAWDQMTSWAVMVWSTPAYYALSLMAFVLALRGGRLRRPRQASATGSPS